MQITARHVMPEPPDLGCPIWDCQEAADTDAPVPLCTRHLRLAFAYVLGQVEAKSAEVVSDPAPPEPPRRDAEDGWVYFIRIGKLIKIGWSGLPSQRFKQLRPDEVLHVEPGSMVDEKRCHLMFEHIRHHGEYFHPAPELLAFIEVLRRPAA